ncbi:hypothetical protein PYW07_008416 [Mythimna separata]|uniref:N-terminal acetyltransferase B complex subunit MDM20 homolog n=1 Tax=Mythimna separata TaxID=271217 RepID=A0AAD7YCM4_MYTSE|nr:hypothetical protein PYW07_008416 [Mythimna separata]
MAVRPQHMHDGGIVERRLRPIYDWLDNGNNKKALQEAEKVLKKSPLLQAARALKALALFRLGKASEAHVVLEALADEKPSDDTTLQAMTISYRESQQLHKVCMLYENAVKAEQSSEELHSHLFMSYVRVGDYRSQQRAAMSLYKFAPKNPYYFWAVMSIVLQAKTSEDNTKRGILLALAQRMVDNFITENKMEAEQEARLYIMILELQEKWEDILKFIESPLYSQLVPGNTAQACIPYLKKLGEWKRLNIVCKELLWDNQDRWDYYVPYFDSVFRLIEDNEEDSESAIDNSAEKCHEFICSLVESMTSGRTLRGPYLARLELWKRLAVDGDPTSLIGSGLALCVQYLRVFANKPCAVPDLRPYLGMIPQKEREEHCREFLTCLGFDENSEPETADDIQRHVSCLSAWRLVAEPLPADGALALATTLRGHYLRCLKKGLITSSITEFCAADAYGILAAHHYYYAGVLQQSSAPVVDALCLLELVLHHSPANFHAKLLLVKLYHLLGNALAADSIYQRLEVKHIQLVSLGWLHCARLAPACVASRALQLLADTRAFLKHHGKDSVEHLTYAYKYGTFEKLVELGAWGARLEACAWGALAAREQALLSQLAGPPALLHQPTRLPLSATWRGRPRYCTSPLVCHSLPRKYAYKYGTFEKLVELGAWGARLEACAWGALAAREQALLSQLAGPPALLHQPTRLPLSATWRGRPRYCTSPLVCHSLPRKYAYKYGTFEKLVELGAWGARLEACAWGALAAREQALLSQLAGPPALLHQPTRLPLSATWRGRPRYCTSPLVCHSLPRKYAYKYGTFEKLVELGAWGARLEACAWGALAAREQALLSQLAGPPALLHQPTRLPLSATWRGRPRYCTSPLVCHSLPRKYAYKYGTFEKLVELGAWGARLEACAWGALAAREQALLSQLAGPPALLHQPTRLPLSATWRGRPRYCTSPLVCHSLPRKYAYKYGTFEKLVELGAWGARLEACAWGALAAREQALLSQLAGPPALLHQPTRLPLSATDNRDLNVIVNFEPPQFQDDQLKSRTFDQEVTYLRLKDALVSAIALCIELADSRPVEEKKGHYEQLSTCVDAFSAAMDKCRQVYCEKERISISAPFPSRIIAFVNSPVPYRELYATALRLVGALGVGKAAAAHDACAAATRLLPRAQAQLQAELEVKGDPVWHMRDCLESLSNYLEFIGIITFLLGVCNELFSPANTKKSKKKTNHSPDELKTSALLNELNQTVQNSIGFLENILDEWPKYEFANNLDDNFAKLTLDDKYQSPVESKLKSGRDDMLTDVGNILKRKSKYLKTLLQ